MIEKKYPRLLVALSPAIGRWWVFKIESPGGQELLVRTENTMAEAHHFAERTLRAAGVVNARLTRGESVPTAQ